MSNLPIENEYLPANHQDIDRDDLWGVSPINDPELAEEMYEAKRQDPVILAQLVMDNPANIALLDKNQLALAYGFLDTQIEDLESAKSVVKESIFKLMDADSEELGEYVASKRKTPEFPELTLEGARDLGLTKVEEKVDNALVKKAFKNGAKLGKVEWKEILVMKKKAIENTEVDL